MTGVATMLRVVDSVVFARGVAVATGGATGSVRSSAAAGRDSAGANSTPGAIDGADCGNGRTAGETLGEEAELSMGSTWTDGSG